MRALAVLALLAAVAVATTWEVVDVTCPVCANTFKARAWKSTNSAGGVDRDFCQHARGDQTLMFSVWTCPRCKFTGRGRMFQETPPELVELLKKDNPLKAPIEIDPKLTDTEKIPAWVRYDLQYQMMKLGKGAPVEMLAWSRLRAAHTQRFGWRGLYPKPLWAKVKAIRERDKDKLPEGDYAIEIHLARELEKEGPDGRLLAAGLYFGRGESPDARRVLDGLRADKDLTDEKKKIVAGLDERLAREKRFLALALPLFQEAAPKSKHRLDVLYLCGELQRKIGRTEKAIETLDALLKEKLSGGQRKWVEEALAKARQ